MCVELPTTNYQHNFCRCCYISVVNFPSFGFLAHQQQQVMGALLNKLCSARLAVLILRAISTASFSQDVILELCMQIKHRRLVRYDRTVVPDYDHLLAQRADLRKLLQDLQSQVCTSCLSADLPCALNHTSACQCYAHNAELLVLTSLQSCCLTLSLLQVHQSCCT